ncbi:MAG TPA: hypothetical protein VGR96_04750 [Acidobacteriaceae bacterium]|nr:hypothetical protein [Acidobacteriaceae bacterium]
MDSASARKPLNGEVDPRMALVERLAASQHLKSSARLRDLLFYVADCAIREAPAEATEQQIGVHVFHRAPGYNSSEDSIVRTHARLLRQKLAAYFAEEGASENLVLEVPKGHYFPVFRPRAARDGSAALTRDGTAASTGAKPQLAPLTPEITAKPRRLRWSAWAFLLLLPLMATSVAWFWRPWAKPAVAPSPVERFWRPFLTDDPPLVIYSNALFEGDSTRGLRYAPGPPPDLPESTRDYVDTYTGIGELTSVYNLTRLFDSYRSRFTLKRSLLMTWDEARSRNLVFIGSIAENPSLRVLQSTTDFSMTAEPGWSGVVNHHPKPGEPGIFSRPERPLMKDYAILALLPGVQSGKHMLIFSGLTTFGTQAAVDYVCRPDSVSELLGQITGPRGEIRPFEAVLETTIGGGVPLQTRLVTIRVH